ncbi:MAG: sigma-70 family RNA polymerase sigma factor [Bacilli bacterium]|nr:sigma-70 family RNA polymerase sigma factor [Bacilli bacterium]
MEYKDFDDGELFMLVCEEDETAKEILYNKYKHVIDIIMKKYIYNARMVGIEYKDLYSEALIGFTDALTTYNADKESSLKTFISMCINSRLQKAIIHAKAKKNKFNNETYSLEHVYGELGVPLEDIISDNSKNDPLTSMMDEEGYLELIETIKSSLSDFEVQVFELMISGFNYVEIANLLDKTPKQIDNTIQRLKSKVKKILDDK